VMVEAKTETQAAQYGQSIAGIVRKANRDAGLMSA